MPGALQRFLRGAPRALILASPLVACARDDVPSANDMAELDRGVGLMGQYDFTKAHDFSLASHRIKTLAELKDIVLEVG